MLARRYAEGGVADDPLPSWIAFLDAFARDAFATFRPGGRLALLLANQTEKDLPAGHGYIDHAFLGYNALIGAGFLPERRISCPMDGAYLPQHVRRARLDGRMLGPGPRPDRRPQALDLKRFRRAARRPPARRPCPGRTGC